MDAAEFERLREAGYNRIPVCTEVLADLDTPLSTYRKLANTAYSYLFESVQGGEKWGRYSIIGLPCSMVYKVEQHRVSQYQSGRLIETQEVEDPLAWVESLQTQYRVPDLPGLPRFHGGLVGYFGYDTVRYVEDKLSQSCPKDELNTPDIVLMVSEKIVVFDNLSGKVQLIYLTDPETDGALEHAQDELQKWVRKLRETDDTPSHPKRSDQAISESDFQPGFPETGFKNAVSRIKDYILAGDVMQTVIAQRMSIEFDAPSLDLYRSLRSLNPSPYMYYLDLGDFQIAGSSPEILARVEDGEVTVRPIAGTRKRGRDDAHDKALEADLLSDPKELAEHLMLIDLGRNDIGRVCETGTVELTDQMIIERYSHVMHIVSNVKGQLKNNASAMDVLRATFPAGTLSGAPKIRAMEIIDELEPVKRGVYGGAIGYLAWNGNMDTAIAIRTAVIKDGAVHVQAGAGVVADSVPDLEWQETMNKARAVFRAVAMAAKGLDHAS